MNRMFLRFIALGVIAGLIIGDILAKHVINFSADDRLLEKSTIFISVVTFALVSIGVYNKSKDGDEKKLKKGSSILLGVIGVSFIISLWLSGTI